MGKNDVLGIIVLNWNGFDKTVKCLQSLTQSNLSNARIYVVDNASANNEADAIAHQFPQVTILPQLENTGFCKGNNIGIQRAMQDGADLIVLLNNDTIVPAEAINKLAAEFLKIPDAGAISPVLLQYPEIEHAQFIRASWDSDRAQFVMNPEKKTYADVEKSAPWKSEFANGCCLLTSTDVIKKVGLLDERYFAYYDEADWCRRLEKVGFSSYVSAASFIYHVKDASIKHTRISTYLLTRNRLLWMSENLTLSERAKSLRYLSKEFVWHALNLLSIVKGNYPKDVSKAYLLGWMDFKLRRLGRWNDRYQSFFNTKHN